MHHIVVHVMAQSITIRREYGAYSVIHGRDGYGEGRVATLQPVTEEIADEIRGKIPDVDGTPVVYIGDSPNKHYYQSHDLDELDDAIVDAILNNSLDLVLVDGADGGWKRWDGRPEWSESYIDFSEAEVVSGENQ
jgi:hypothetical protein